MGFKVMGLDSSTSWLTVGYIEDGRVLGEHSVLQSRLAGTHVVPWLMEFSTLLGQPDGLAVGIGPGSYTGVRIAVSAAKALGYAWDIPIKGVSSLAAWALSAKGRIIVTSERRGPAFYLGYYWSDRYRVEALAPETAVSGELPPLFPVHEVVTILGPAGADPSLCRQLATQAEVGQDQISGVQVAQLAWPALQWGKADDPMVLAPSYLRPAAKTR